MLKAEDPALHIFKARVMPNHHRGSVIPEDLSITGLITLSSIGKTLTNIVFTPQPLSTTKPKNGAKGSRVCRAKEGWDYSPLKAIWRYCKYDCMAESPTEVLLCDSLDCPLWPYRFGFSVNDKRFTAKLQRIRENYPDQFEELKKGVRNAIKIAENSQKIALLSIVLALIKGGAIPEQGPKSEQK